MCVSKENCISNCTLFLPIGYVCSLRQQLSTANASFGVISTQRQSTIGGLQHLSCNNLTMQVVDMVCLPHHFLSVFSIDVN